MTTRGRSVQSGPPRRETYAFLVTVRAFGVGINLLVLIGHTRLEIIIRKRSCVVLPKKPRQNHQMEMDDITSLASAPLSLSM